MNGRRIAVLLGIALLAGCGSGTKQAGPAGGAEIAPSSTAALLRLDTSFGSEQWRSVDSMLRRFPAAADLLDRVGGLKGGAGPETDVLALSAEDLDTGVVLGLTQPRNEARLDTLLAGEKPPLVAETVGDWRVIARTRAAIDNFKRARIGGSLAGSSTYRDATSSLPAPALATVYLNGAALSAAADRRVRAGSGPRPTPGLGRLSWLAGAVTGEERALRVELRVKGDEIEVTPFAAELPEQVPAAGVSLYVGFKGLDRTLEELKRSPELADQLGAAARSLGDVLDGVVALFKEEGALYARQLPAGPEVTLVLLVSDEAAATDMLGGLTTLVGALDQKLPERTRVAGVTATRITVDTSSVYFAVFDGKLVVSTALSGFRGLRAATPRLAGSTAWQRAVATAGMPDRTTGILYADAPRALPLFPGLAQGKVQSSGPETKAAGLGTALLYGSVDGPVLSVKGFVSIR